MTTPMPLGIAPYISPTTLQNAPTGIDFSTIPATPSFDPAANAAELWNLCTRATAMADQYCNQTLRATVDTEVLHGPDYRVTAGPAAGGGSVSPYWGTTGYNTRAIMARWPILSVTQVQVSPNNVWPRTWTTLPAGMAEPEYPPWGLYNSVAPASDANGSQAILIAPGWVTWCHGRNGFILQITYVNGWPHSEITSNVVAGATTISVSDTTGWAVSNYQATITGATGIVKDAGLQETFKVLSGSATSGPGTLTLSSPLVYPHDAGTLITTIPAAIEQACVLFCCAQALIRGATSTTIHSVGGHPASSAMDISELTAEAELLLHPYRRTI
jgi:hypothetical protein